MPTERAINRWPSDSNRVSILNMPSTRTQGSQWRPRYSLRSLLVLVTLTCLYFGLWKMTMDAAQKYGGNSLDRELVHRDSLNEVAAVGSPCPFVISCDRHSGAPTMIGSRRYYIWPLGWGRLWKLPFESTWQIESPPDIRVSPDDTGGFYIPVEAFGPREPSTTPPHRPDLYDMPP